MVSEEPINYTLKDMDSNFYFTKQNAGHLYENVPLEEIISMYRNKWVQVLKESWIDFLEHCSYFMLQYIEPEYKYNHEFPKEFEPTLDYFVLFSVKNFDEKVLSKYGWYLSSRAGHGYDLGLLNSLGRGWIESILY